MICYNLAELDSNKTYGILRAEVTKDPDGIPETRVISNNEIYLLIGREPFLHQDKELHAYIKGTSLIDSPKPISYRQSIGTGAYEMVVDNNENIITQIYNPLVPVIPVSSFLMSEISTKAKENIISGAENLKRKFILGPS